MYSDYEWSPDNDQQRLIGYFVQRQLTVDLRELDALGSLMERAVSTGVNIISGPMYGSTREAALRRTAIRRAAVEARERTSFSRVVGRQGWAAVPGHH